jgi:flagellar assembly protein FliH
MQGMIMSDPVILPIALSQACSHQGSFRPRFSLGYSPGFTFADAQAEQTGEDLYAIGLADGQEIAQAAFAVERMQLQALIASAQALQSEPSEELAVLIAETIEQLVRQCVGVSPVDRDHLNAQATRAAKLINECDQARTMWVHPDDLPLIDQSTLPVAVMADPGSARGAIRIDCSAGWIEHGTPLYLEELRMALGITERGA